MYMAMQQQANSSGIIDQKNGSEDSFNDARHSAPISKVFRPAIALLALLCLTGFFLLNLLGYIQRDSAESFALDNFAFYNNSRGDVRRANLSLSSNTLSNVSSNKRVRAAIVTLARNSDYMTIYNTIVEFEKAFNSKYDYPYVFLNDEPFTNDFKDGITKLIMGDVVSSTRNVSFGLVPKEHWSYPEWIDQEKAANARRDSPARSVKYGEIESYHFMCRYFSGFFYRHPLLEQLDYYWRLEPGARYYCDLNYDPFLFMQENKKDYGFVIIMPEVRETIPTLWPTVKKYLKEVYANVRPTKLDSPVLKALLSTTNSTLRDDYLKLLLESQDPLDSEYGDTSWAGCHFWSNFEIGSLNFLSSPQYQSYFDYLDKTGGFFYERWGDAPVHTVAAGIFLETTQVHHFSDIGYQHDPYPYMWCPPSDADKHGVQCRCSFDSEINFAKTRQNMAQCMTDFLLTFSHQ